MKEQKDHQINLYLDQKKDIDSIRKDVESLMRTDLNLSHKQDLMSQKLDTLTERINEGVSKTAWNTHKDVGEIKKMMIEMAGANALRDEKIESNQREVGRLKQGAYWVAFIGVCGGLVGLIVQVLRNLPG